MSELEYDTNFATELLAAGITPSKNPINLRGVIKQIIQNLIPLASATTTTSAPSAGGAGALPATPAGYLTVPINGVNHEIPYY